MINKKLIFIQSTYGDAHQMMRYIELKKHYRESSLLAFEREYYQSGQDIEFKSLGKIEHGKYLKRIGKYIKAFQIVKGCKSQHLENDVYFYGFDLLPLFSVSKPFLECNLIFEIPDIREVYFKKGIKSRIQFKILKKSIERIPFVIVTSELFVSKFLMRKGIRIINYYTLENKVHLNKKNDSFSFLKNQDKIIIGYFGLLRCKRSLMILLDLVRNNERFEVVIYGYFMGISEKLKNRLMLHERIQYKGEYKSPKDLEKIYDDIDISWIAYPYSSEIDGNYKYARTNRFYESGYFIKPMIANKESGDAFYVEKYSIGINLDMSDINKSVKEINTIDSKKIDLWKENILTLDINIFQSSENDYKQLLIDLENNEMECV